MKKLLAMMMALAMVLSLASCSSGNSDSGESASESSATPAVEETGAPADEDEAEETDAAAEEGDDTVYTVGICQLMQHDALDAATQGFQDALVDALGEDHVKFDLQNAQGDSTTCSTIVTGFVSNSYDLIMANATPALQAAVSATDTIPIVGTSVTDYATALAYDSWDGTTGINVTGTSDLAPLDQQEQMILELVPDVQKVAILYCSAEANSVYQASVIESYLDADGVAYQEYTFADSNDLQSVVTAAIADCDVVYVPTDNTAASNMTIVANVCEPAGIPVICGEEGMCSNGGLATLSISYYDIGYAAGEMAAEILTQGTNPGDMTIGTAATTVKEYNADYAAAIGFTMPEDYVAIEE
jgi:putative ABC transport system substrate-binding protein